MLVPARHAARLAGSRVLYWSWRPGGEVASVSSWKSRTSVFCPMNWTEWAAHSTTLLVMSVPLAMGAGGCPLGLSISRTEDEAMSRTLSRVNADPNTLRFLPVTWHRRPRSQVVVCCRAGCAGGGAKGERLG